MRIRSRRDFDLTSFEAAALVSIFLLTYGLMQVPAGVLLDRVGVRWALPLAAVGAALAVAAFGGATSFGQLVTARVAAGVFMAFAFPAIGKIARRQLPPTRFALAMAVADMAFGASAVIVAGLTEFVDASAWRTLVHVQAGIGLLLALVLVPALRPLSKGQSSALETEAVGSSLGRVLRQRSVVRGALLYAWGAGLTFGFGGYWNLKLQASCGCTAPQVSELSTALFGGLALGMLAAGLLGNRPDRWRPLLIGASTLSTGLVLLLLLASETWSFSLLAALNLVLGIALGTCSLAFAVAARDVSAKQAATVVAFVNAAGCIGGAAFEEFPVWLGGGEATLTTVGIVYVGVALLGTATAFSLPRGGSPVSG